MEKKEEFSLARLYVNYVRNAIDLTVGDEDGYPVSSAVLVKTGVASRKQLELLLKGGFIQGIEFDVPSILMPGQTVKERAYFTERIVPKVAGSLGVRIGVETAGSTRPH